MVAAKSSQPLFFSLVWWIWQKSEGWIYGPLGPIGLCKASSNSAAHYLWGLQICYWRCVGTIYYLNPHFVNLDGSYYVYDARFWVHLPFTHIQASQLSDSELSKKGLDSTCRTIQYCLYVRDKKMNEGSFEAPWYVFLELLGCFVILITYFLLWIISLQSWY